MIEINHYNFGEITHGDWQKVTYKIYSNQTMDIITEYMKDKIIKKESKISFEDYDKLNRLIDKAILVNVEVEAYGGDAWSFICYRNNEIYFQRGIGYIYGIKVLDDITKIIEKYNRKGIKHYE